MKRVLLASASAACLALATPARAAGIPVVDVASISARAIEAAKSLGQMVQQYNVMRQQYDQLVRTYEVLSHPNQVLGIAKGLLQQQMANPGSTPSSIPGLSFGSQLSAGAARFLNQNRYAEVQGDDFAARELRRREQATANIQAEAQAGLERAEERIASLNELRASIEGQPDITAVAAVEARIQSEHLFLQNEANNVARLQLIQQTAARVDAQRVEQSDRAGIEEWHARARARAFGGAE